MIRAGAFLSNRRQEGPVLRAVQPLAQRGQNGRFVASQQSLRIEPQTGKDGALEQPLRLRGDFLIFALPQLPPEQAAFLTRHHADNLRQRRPETRPLCDDFSLSFPFALVIHEL